MTTRLFPASVILAVLFLGGVVLDATIPSATIPGAIIPGTIIRGAIVRNVGPRPGLAAWPSNRGAASSQYNGRTAASSPQARDIEVRGARVLDTGLFALLPPRPPAPVRTGPGMVVGGVGPAGHIVGNAAGGDGGGVVAIPGAPLPVDPLSTRPEREYRLLRRAARLTARPGQAVGFGFVLTGLPRGAAVPVQVVVTFPSEQQEAEPGQRRPLEQKAKGLKIEEREAVLGRPDWAVWEVPQVGPAEGSKAEPEAGPRSGGYVIELRCQGVVLARQAFTVAILPPERPGAQPERARGTRP